MSIGYGMTQASELIESFPYTRPNGEQFTIKAQTDGTFTGISAIGEGVIADMPVIAGESDTHLYKEITSADATLYARW